jgi:hypothetical protein
MAHLASGNATVKPELKPFVFREMTKNEGDRLSPDETSCPSVAGLKT